MAKGASNERSQCRDWSRWWCEGLEVNPIIDVFWRTAGSGAKARVRTTAGNKVLRGYGDMMAEDPVGQPLIDWCTFEFKKGYSNELSLLGILDSRQKEPLVIHFLREIEQDARDAGNWPVLIIHRDRRHPVIFLPIALFLHITQFHGKIATETILRLRHHSIERNYNVIRLVDFFSWAHPKFFLQKVFSP